MYFYQINNNKGKTYHFAEATQEKSVRATGATKSQRKFNGVVVATCGLPARGKTLVAYGLARRLNWNGESAKGNDFLLFLYTEKWKVFFFTIFLIVKNDKMHYLESLKIFFKGFITLEKNFKVTIRHLKIFHYVHYFTIMNIMKYFQTLKFFQSVIKPLKKFLK